jgi:hypothetical protein
VKDVVDGIRNDTFEVLVDSVSFEFEIALSFRFKQYGKRWVVELYSRLSSIFTTISIFTPTQNASNFRGQIIQVIVLKNTTHTLFSPGKKGPMRLKVADV